MKRLTFILVEKNIEELKKKGKVDLTFDNGFERTNVRLYLQEVIQAKPHKYE